MDNDQIKLAWATGIVFVLSLAIAAVLLHISSITNECEIKGGTLIKSYYGTAVCVDNKALIIIKN